jgi:hypothetical protein
LSRFLKSEQYLELLNEREAAAAAGGNGSRTALVNGSLLRVASAKEGGHKLLHNSHSHNSKNSITNARRSPSLSPVLHSGSRWGRRNTCSPASPITLQIPAIQE